MKAGHDTRKKRQDGIRTPEDLLMRCRIDEATGCWLWSGACCEGYPRVWLADVGRVTTGPSAAFYVSRGGLPPQGTVAYMRCICPTCVNPEHVLIGTKKQAGAHLAKSGKLKGDPARAVRNTLNARRSIAKLTPEIAAEIRASSGTLVELGQRFGVAPSCISAVRTGKTWRDSVVHGASVFSLGAA